MQHLERERERGSLLVVRGHHSISIPFYFCTFSGGNLYKRERKKRRPKLSERISESLEAKRACESPSTEPDPAPDLDDSSDPSSGPDDDTIPIHLGDAIKRRLELDFRLVTEENKVSNVVVF